MNKPVDVNNEIVNVGDIYLFYFKVNTPFSLTDSIAETLITFWVSMKPQFEVVTTYTDPDTGFFVVQTRVTE